MFSNGSGLTSSDVLALTNGRSGDDGMFGGNGWWVIILFALIFGWGRGGNGMFGGSGSGASDNYVLASDFATLQRQIDSGVSSLERKGDAITNGICDLGYASLQQTNDINMAIAQSGYESRLATQNLASQLASCCCDIREGIQSNTTQGVMNTNAIQNQIAQCCCENEKLVLQNKYETAQANCATLQAIDKVGDRIIDYMANEKAQALRDENQALRLKASQEAQNNYLISQLGYQCPKPAYVVQPPQQVTFPTSCGCNGNGYANFGGFYNGTTVA